jgi:hypothetical protein
MAMYLSPPFDPSLDISNNVESVFIPDPIPGVYKIEVVGSNVAEATQDYAWCIQECLVGFKLTYFLLLH